jgi:hypothetical protein
MNLKIGQSVWYWNGKEAKKIVVESMQKSIYKDGARIERINDKRVDINFVFKTKKALKEYLIKEAEEKSTAKIEQLKSI